MPGKKKIYWDANIFLAWLKDEQQWGAVIMGGIEETVNKAHKNEIILFTSTMTQTEIYDSRLSPKAKEMLEALFKRRNVKMISVDHKISQLSSFIRDYYHRKAMQIASPDAIHLATAIMYEADEFHTLDGAGKKKRTTDLLKLGTKIAGRYNLLIRTPKATNRQMSLTAGVPTMQIEGSKDKHQASTSLALPSAPPTEIAAEKPNQSEE